MADQINKGMLLDELIRISTDLMEINDMENPDFDVFWNVMFSTVHELMHRIEAGEFDDE